MAKTAERCPYCRATVVYQVVSPEPIIRHEEDEDGEVLTHETLAVRRCPACGELVIDFHEWEFIVDVNDYMRRDERRLAPSRRAIRADLTSAFIPEEFRRLFNEAAAIEALSIRGACALLRTCLEALLIQRKYSGNLDSMIDQARAKEAWPVSLLTKLHLVRLLGNWGAHWILDQSGNVVDVDEAELEAMFSTVEQALLVVFVEPQLVAKDVERLNAKLAKTGRSMRLSASGALCDEAGAPWSPKKSKS